jgi:hypothetical protein
MKVNAARVLPDARSSRKNTQTHGTMCRQGCLKPVVAHQWGICAKTGHSETFVEGPMRQVDVWPFVKAITRQSR